MPAKEGMKLEVLRDFTGGQGEGAHSVTRVQFSMEMKLIEGFEGEQASTELSLIEFVSKFSWNVVIENRQVSFGSSWNFCFALLCQFSLFKKFCTWKWAFSWNKRSVVNSFHVNYLLLGIIIRSRQFFNENLIKKLDIIELSFHISLSLSLLSSSFIVIELFTWKTTENFIIELFKRKLHRQKAVSKLPSKTKLSISKHPEWAFNCKTFRKIPDVMQIHFSKA